MNIRGSREIGKVGSLDEDVLQVLQDDHHDFPGDFEIRSILQLPAGLVHFHDVAALVVRVGRIVFQNDSVALQLDQRKTMSRSQHVAALGYRCESEISTVGDDLKILNINDNIDFDSIGNKRKYKAYTLSFKKESGNCQ